MAVPARWLLAPLCALSLHAAAQDTVLLGTVQSVTLQVKGEGDCPDPCGDVPGNAKPGSGSVCIDNGGGCESMVVAVERVYRGAVGSQRWQFRQPIGEWGPKLPRLGERVVLSVRDQVLHWSVASVKNEKTMVDARRFVGAARSSANASHSPEVVDVDTLLARLP